jgi:uncharacterized lipoprotein YddW (UPF0748 family)
MFIRVAVITLALVTFSRAQSRPAGLEPGEAEGRNKTRAIEPNLKFTHPTTEARGVWLASNDLLGSRDLLLHKFDRLKSAHFTTVMIDSYFRGYTAYPGSAIAPEYPDLKGEDTLGLVINEAHQRGLKAQAWVSYGFYAYWTPDASKDSSMGAILEKNPQLVSIDAEGRKLIHRNVGDFYSLCAANPKSHEILGQLMVEIATKYTIDAIHLDRIRFPEAEFCYCDYCKVHFKADTGIDLKPFARGSDEQKKWTEWKRQQTLAAVKHFEKVIHAAKRGLPITAYVVGPDEMDSRGQSWDLWAKAGVLDAIAVSMYSADVHPAADKALARLGESGKSRLICALSADKIPTSIYSANIQAARDVSPLGQYTWFLGQLDDVDFDALEAGSYSQPARDPIIK